MGYNRFFKPGFGRKREVDKLSDLYYLAVQLDNIRAFRRVGTEKIESAFQRINSTGVWRKIKSDVEEIVYLPNTIPGVPRLTKIVMTLRTLFPTCVIFIILALLIRFGFIPIPAPALSYVLIFFAIFVMLSFVALDFTIRRRIVRYEEEHPAMQSREKEHIRDVVQELIKELLKEIRSRGEDPGRYKMRLFHKDYRGLRIIKEYRERIFGIFKRKHSIYLAIPSL